MGECATIAAMPVLETDRLVLRELTLDDAAMILALLNEPGFLEFVGDKGVRDLSGARRYLTEGPLASYERNGFGLLCVLVKDIGRDPVPIGICGFLTRAGQKDVEIGFALLESSSGRGYGTEAAAAVLDWGRETLGLERILAVADPENAASLRILEKIGMRPAGRCPGSDGKELARFLLGAC